MMRLKFSKPALTQDLLVLHRKECEKERKPEIKAWKSKYKKEIHFKHLNAFPNMPMVLLVSIKPILH